MFAVGAGFGYDFGAGAAVEGFAVDFAVCGLAGLDVDLPASVCSFAGC